MLNALPAEPKLIVQAKAYFYDTDAGGVVHNVAYLRMIETARSELAEHLGWKLSDMLTVGSPCPVVARTEIDYIKPARLGDPLEIEGRLVAMEKIKFTLEFEVRNDRGACCRARQIMVPVDLKSGRPQPLRADWRERWPALVVK
jgi:acyl-CoA thioester hydrolase